MPKEEMEKVLTSIPALVNLIKFRRSLKTLVFIVLECQEQSATKLKVELACSSVSSRVDFKLLLSYCLPFPPKMAGGTYCHRSTLQNTVSEA